MLYFWIAIAIFDLFILLFLALLCQISLRSAPNDIRKREFRPNSQLERLQQEIAEKELFFSAHQEEQISIRSQGVYLYAKRYPQQAPIGRILLFHGYRSIAETDFACAMDLYYSLGYELILVDQRAHGRSGGNWIGFGVLERKDCLNWVHYLNQTYGALPSFLSGISMGCSTVLMALGLPLPQNVKGVIADCGFTSPKEIIRHVMERKLWLPAPLLMPVLSLFSKIFAGYFFGEYSTLDALKENKIPILFIHGTDDKFVPTEMTIRNYQTCTAEKRLVLVKGAGHGTSHLQDRETVEQEIKAFLKKHHG